MCTTQAELLQEIIPPALRMPDALHRAPATLVLGCDASIIAVQEEAHGTVGDASSQPLELEGDSDVRERSSTLRLEKTIHFFAQQLDSM